MLKIVLVVLIPDAEEPFRMIFKMISNQRYWGKESIYWYNIFGIKPKNITLAGPILAYIYDNAKSDVGLPKQSFTNGT